MTEARGRVGGNITTAEDAGRGYLWEEGPNSFQNRSFQPNDSMLEAAVDAGRADQLVFGDPKAPRGSCCPGTAGSARRRAGPTW